MNTPKFDKWVKKFTDAGCKVEVKVTELGPKAITQVSKSAVIKGGPWNNYCLGNAVVYPESGEFFQANRKMLKRLGVK